ncbi:phage baseplate assembly protein V [Dickeya oryzae]
MTQAENDGLWARLASYYASSGIGAQFMPEVGDEVILGYFNNNPSDPVILGSLYSSKNPPPVTPEAKKHPQNADDPQPVNVAVQRRGQIHHPDDPRRQSGDAERQRQNGDVTGPERQQRHAGCVWHHARQPEEHHPQRQRENRTQRRAHRGYQRQSRRHRRGDERQPLGQNRPDRQRQRHRRTVGLRPNHRERRHRDDQLTLTD